MSTPGVLITSDVQSIVYLTTLNESAETKFILAKLDAKNVFVRTASLKAVNAALVRRLQQTVFTAEGEAEE